MKITSTSISKPLLLIFCTLIIFNSFSVNAISSDDVQASIRDAYILVAKAEQSGGDVTNLVVRLNQAAFLARVGDDNSLARSIEIINEVKNDAVKTALDGVQTTNFQFIQIAYSLFLLAIIGFFIYFFGSQVFWRFWLRSKKKWVAENP